MKFYLFFLATIFLGLTARGQTIINGLVRAADDTRPLPGVTVSIDGTRLATSTNDKGRFSMAFRGTDARLTFRLIGYRDTMLRVSAPRDTFIQLSLLPQTNTLEAVHVSTGYQTLPKERATGSFSQVDRKTLEQQAGMDILSRLEATVNGLTVDRATGATPQISIRGLSTIRGPRAPLIVVDNFPYEGDITNINPNEVESVTVLKDAAAASIWGARAGNGVIVITTKKGKLNQPLSIDLNTFFSVANKPNLNYLRWMSSNDFINVEQDLYQKGFYSSWISSTGRRLLSDVVETLRQRDAGTLSAAAATTRIDGLRQQDVRQDFDRYVYRRAVNQQYALSLRGGAATHSWTGSAGYDANVNSLDARYRRLNLRFDDLYRPLKNLQLQAGIYYTRSEERAGRSGLGTLTQYLNGILPYARLADDQGQPVALPRTYATSYLATQQNRGLLDWNYYPLLEQASNNNTTTLQDVLINTGLNYRLPFGLSADVKYQYERQATDNRNLQDASSWYARDLVNRYSQFDAAGRLLRNIPAGGVLDQSANRLEVHNLRGQLNFDRTWGKHAVTALAGGELRRAGRNSVSSRVYGYRDDILTFGTVDYRTAFPDLVSGTPGYVPDGASLSDTQNNFLSGFGNAAYTYDQKYTLSLSGRQDASNLFGLRTNDQWNPFYSVGLSWLISDEHFFKATWLSQLKLRATYGQSGNIDPALTAVTTIEYNAVSPYTALPFSRFRNYYNPELRWETAKMFNFGVDFKLAGDRLGGSVEYYRKKGENLFGTALVDYTTGIGSTILRNVAAMQGKGLDVELHGRLLTRKVGWQSTLNFSYYRDKVTDYYLANQTGSSFVGGSPTISGVTGKPVYSIFAYRWAGLNPETGAPRGYEQGQISENYARLTGPQTQLSDLDYFGSAIPVWFGSWGHTLTYKQLSLNFSLVYKLGYYFRRSSISYSSLYNNWTGHADYALRWQKPGDEVVTNVPSAVYPGVSNRDAFYLNSAPLVEKGDHVRLQYLNLAYELTRQHWHRLPFKSLQVYANASNLGILWRANKQGLDPDYNYFTNTIVPPSVLALGLRANL